MQYWDWPKYASAPQDSPIFDGSPTSLGGNGESIVHDGPVLVAPDGLSTLPIPAGVGGGFVNTGPFANMSVNLGPVGGLDGVAPGPDGGLGYNPRGLKRDVGPAVNMRYANYSTVLSECILNFWRSAVSSLLTRIFSQTFYRNPISRSIVRCPKVLRTPLKSAPMAADTT